MSKLYTNVSRQHHDLSARDVFHREAVGRTHSKLDTIHHDTGRDQVQTQSKSDALAFRVEDVRVSISGFIDLAEQVINYVQSFSNGIQESLRFMMQSNWQIFQMLLKVQQSITQHPTALLQSNIKFEDVLGEYRELPYEYFRHWEVFKPFL